MACIRVKDTGDYLRNSEHRQRRQRKTMINTPRWWMIQREWVTFNLPCDLGLLWWHLDKCINRDHVSYVALRFIGRAWRCSFSFDVLVCYWLLLRDWVFSLAKGHFWEQQESCCCRRLWCSRFGGPCYCCFGTVLFLICDVVLLLWCGGCLECLCFLEHMSCLLWLIFTFSWWLFWCPSLLLFCLNVAKWDSTSVQMGRDNTLSTLRSPQGYLVLSALRNTNLIINKIISRGCVWNT